MSGTTELILISRDSPTLNLSSIDSTTCDSDEDPERTMERRYSACSSSLESFNSRDSSAINFDEDSEMSIQEWSSWVEQYGAGIWPADKPLPIPARLLPQSGMTLSTHSSSSNLSTKSTVSKASSFEIYETGPSTPVARVSADDRTPEAIAQHFRENGYLGAPTPGVHEAQRLRTMKKYGLLQPTRRDAVDRVCRIVKSHFKTPTVVLSLILQDHSVLAAEVTCEPPNDAAPREVGLNDSLCSHAVSKPAGSECFVVPNASADWRFANNPSVRENGPLQFYASANINLPVSTDSNRDKDTPELLPVGSICVIDSRARTSEQFGSESRAMLRDFADLLARELQLGYERERREVEARQTAFVGEFLANSSTDNCSRSVSPTGSPRPQSRQTSITELARADRPFQKAAKALRKLTTASTASILDLRSFRRTVQSETERTGFVSQATASTIYLLGNNRATASDFDWSQCVEAQEDDVAHCIREALLEQTDRSSTSLDGLAPFASLLPADTSAVTLVPIWDGDAVDGTPSLLLILTSNEAHRTFESSDLKFVENVGHIVLASLLRTKAFEADRSKLLFLASVSHELRTPLHGLGSQVELIREFSTELPKIGPWLECAEVCLEALKDVLNDTLDFSKLANKSSKEINDAKGKNNKRVDLEKLLEDVVLATWVRKRRVDLVTDQEKPVKVDVILAIEERMTGWIAMIDVGGLKRTLLNVLGNALKFTKAGSVRIALSEVAASPFAAASNLRTVQFLVEDTGIGMSPEFLRAGAFVPFRQEDPFAVGTGLGLSICEQIIHRMGGTIDVVSVLHRGTSVRIVLPLELLVSSPVTNSSSAQSKFASRSKAIRPSTTRRPSTAGAATPSYCTRNISDELSNLFDPSFSALRIATPPFEHTAFNFSQALEKVNSQYVPPSISGSPASTLEPPITFNPLHELHPPALSSLQVRGLLLRKDSDDTSTSSLKGSVFSSVTSMSSQDSLLLGPTKKSLAPDIRVLVADDNPIARSVLAKLLGGKGIEFVQCVDGQEAFDAYRQYGHFDIALLDLQMPRVDGIEAAHLIREHERMHSMPPCRIVALTGLSSALDMARGDGLVDVWLIKGGKSMRAVLDEIVALQLVQDAKRLVV